MKRTWLTGLMISTLALTTFAATQTTLFMTKTTRLTGQDAQVFQKVFPNSYINSPFFSAHCKKNECIIRSSRPTFGSEVASKLLNKRHHATFKSQDGQFVLHCTTATIEHCNVVQRNAVLKD